MQVNSADVRQPNLTRNIILESRELRERFQDARGGFATARAEAIKRIAEAKAMIAVRSSQRPC